MTTAPAIPTLSSHQLSLALDLLDMRDIAPKEVLRQLDELAKRGEFSQAQAKALRVLVKTLDDANAARVLRASCDGDDPESMDLLRQRIAHEARIAYLR
jgi:predicted component of type VI protein secretion system